MFLKNKRNLIEVDKNEKALHLKGIETNYEKIGLFKWIIMAYFKLVLGHCVRSGGRVLQPFVKRKQKITRPFIDLL